MLTFLTADNLAQTTKFMRDQMTLDVSRCDNLEQVMQQVLERQELLTEDS